MAESISKYILRAICTVVLSALSCGLCSATSSGYGLEGATFDYATNWSHRTDLAVKDTFALHLTPYGVQISNILTQQIAEVVGQTGIPGKPVRMDVSGNLLYLITAEAELLVCDLSMLPTISEISRTSCGQIPQDVAASDGYVYILDQDTVRVLDCRSPDSPVQIATASLNGEYWSYPTLTSMRLADSLLIVATKHVHLFDVSTPPAINKLATVNTPLSAADAVVVGSRLVVADRSQGGTSSLRSYALGAGGESTLLGSVDVFGIINAVQLSGDTLFSAHDTRGIAAWDVSSDSVVTLLACGRTRGNVGDMIATPYGLVANCRQLTDVEYPQSVYTPCGMDTTFMSAVEPLQDAPWTGGEVLLVQLNESLELTVASALDGLLHAEGVIYDSGRLITLDRNMGISVSTQEGAGPFIARGQMVTPKDYAEAFNVRGNLAFVATGRRGVVIFDVAIPSDITIVATIPSLGWATDADAQGNLLAVADETAGLALFDISNPVIPDELGRVLEGHAIVGVRLNGNIAYATDRLSWLWVMDISLPSQVMIIDSISLSAGSLELIDDLLIVTANSGIYLFDVQDTGVPEETARIIPSHYAYGCGCNGEVLCVYNGTSGFELYDISDRYSPLQVGLFDTPGGCFGATVSGNKLWIADYAGLLEYTLNSATGIGEDDRPLGELPTTHLLGQNYPNPFNPSTTIQFSVANQGRVLLKVYNVLGREVSTLVDGLYSAGTYSVKWSPAQTSDWFATGVYFYRLSMGEWTQTRKMMYVR